VVPMRLSSIFCVLVLTMSGCAYEHSAGRRDASEMPFVYEARGWDSGLAYGLAEGAAWHSGREGEPDAVTMDCTMYGAKPAIMAVLAGVAGLIAHEGHPGVALAPIALAIPVAFIPNCHATLGYFYRAAPPRPPAPVMTSPEPPDLPVRLLHRTSPDGGAGSPDTVPPSDGSRR
jgi:hypothetical protein